MTTELAPLVFGGPVPPCDECGHADAVHVDAYNLPEPLRTATFVVATCWAQLVCRECDPRVYRRLAERGGYHAFEDDGAGRCAARPMGRGQFPVCEQWAENDVHTLFELEVAR